MSNFSGITLCTVTSDSGTTAARTALEVLEEPVTSGRALAKKLCRGGLAAAEQRAFLILYALSRLP